MNSEASPIAACLAELRAKRETLDGLIRALEQFEPAGPRCAPPLRHKRAAKPAKNGNGTHKPPRKRQAIVQPLREIVDGLAEPFNAADAEAALPDVKKGYLRCWAQAGQLQVVTAGKPGSPTTFKRSSTWAVDPKASPVARSYQQFRRTIKTPEPIDA